MSEHRPKVVSRRDLFLRFRQIIRPEPDEHAANDDQLVAYTQAPTETSHQLDDDIENPAGAQCAIINTAKCLAWQGSFCSTCVEHCPEPGAIARTYGKPTIVADHCTGCGQCIDRCPAPQNAIQLANHPNHV
ncbi:4Fe-4S dicluster domain-containing protein [Persicirhabdus sediminis]|uniref:4Fe-4S binding protein n=1 Tax=Persicirhabdus sediminis TaxID=454144 RepID=A0A8J7SNP6_9BACT|nr:4Fe-4S binding protein [Persicirhabdus sediminis]MBK1791808.1 4Fe-4S binding protein [Persicirhabdus sediminis]